MRLAAYLACGVCCILCCQKVMAMDLKALGKVLEDLKEVIDIEQEEDKRDDEEKTTNNIDRINKEKLKREEESLKRISELENALIDKHKAEDNMSMATKRTVVIKLKPITFRICRQSDFKSLRRNFCPLQMKDKRRGRRGKCYIVKCASSQTLMLKTKESS